MEAQRDAGVRPVVLRSSVLPTGLQRYDDRCSDNYHCDPAKAAPHLNERARLVRSVQRDFAMWRDRPNGAADAKGSPLRSGFFEFQRLTRDDGEDDFPCPESDLGGEIDTIRFGEEFRVTVRERLDCVKIQRPRFSNSKQGWWKQLVLVVLR
jgi:hypothetical protein